jgi:hypothetical protein
MHTQNARRTTKPNTMALTRILAGVEGHNKRVLAPFVEVSDRKHGVCHGLVRC